MNVKELQAATGCAASAAAEWLSPLLSAMSEFHINTPARQAMFLAQIGHESRSLTCAAESLYYTDPARIARIFKSGFDANHNGIVDPEEIEAAKAYVRDSRRLANRAYANRMGNGSEASGDGYRYRGRGPMQTTGKDGYLKTGQALGLDLVANPDLLMDPKVGARAAAWFWSSHNLNALADAGDIHGCTVRINGGTTGLSDRTERWKSARKALCA